MFNPIYDWETFIGPAPIDEKWRERVTNDKTGALYSCGRAMYLTTIGYLQKEQSNELLR